MQYIINLTNAPFPANATEPDDQKIMVGPMDNRCSQYSMSELAMLMEKKGRELIATPDFNLLATAFIIMNENAHDFVAAQFWISLFASYNIKTNVWIATKKRQVFFDLTLLVNAGAMVALDAHYQNVLHAARANTGFGE